VKVSAVAWRGVAGIGAVQSGFIEAVGATRAAAFWEGARVGGNDDWRPVISGRGVCEEGAGEGRGWREMNCVGWVMGYRARRGAFEDWARKGHWGGDDSRGGERKRRRAC
jgi:hypothetical protein